MSDPKVPAIKPFTHNEQVQYFAPQIVIAIVAALAFLGTHFLLGSWAEASAANHNIEHIIIFLSGASFGSALFNILRSLKH